jgi:hypothetical protein
MKASALPSVKVHLQGIIAQPRVISLEPSSLLGIERRETTFYKRGVIDQLRCTSVN